MLTSTLPRTAPAVKFESLNWVATDALPRDQAQSHRLHEPEYRLSTIDRMTGDDIEDVTSHPSLADGNLTIYFETQATRKAYRAMPIDHPVCRTPPQMTTIAAVEPSAQMLPHMYPAYHRFRYVCSRLRPLCKRCFPTEQ